MKAAWYDKPTEPGLWVFWEDDSRDLEGDTQTLYLTLVELVAWQSPDRPGSMTSQFFGPISTPPKFVAPDNASGVQP